MQDELPLALVEEQAEGEIAAENGRCDGGCTCFEEPHGVDCFGLGGWLRGALGRLCGRAGHEGVCMNFSIGMDVKMEVGGFSRGAVGQIVWIG